MIRMTFGELVTTLHDKALARHGNERRANLQTADAVSLALALNLNAETVGVLALLTELDGVSVTDYPSLGYRRD